MPTVLADHLNWAHVNGKTPDTVTLEDLQRYMNGVTGQTDGVYGIAWRKPKQKPLGASAAGNVATIVKAYYLAFRLRSTVSPELVEALTVMTVAAVASEVQADGRVESVGTAQKRAVDRASCQTRWWRRCFSREC